MGENNGGNTNVINFDFANTAPKDKQFFLSLNTIDGDSIEVPLNSTANMQSLEFTRSRVRGNIIGICLQHSFSDKKEAQKLQENLPKQFRESIEILLLEVDRNDFPKMAV